MTSLEKKLLEALLDATAHLAGATSAYERFAGNSKRAGVRDALYSTRLSDFKKATERARAAVALAGREVVKDSLTTEGPVSFLREAATYFRNRPTNGEDSAHWANVYNAENCEKAADRIEALERELVEAKKPCRCERYDNYFDDAKL